MSEPWWPTTADVAALLTARTLGASGEEVGDFTESTRPTSEQVEVLIEQSVGFVRSGLGDAAVSSTTIHDSVRALIALRTAMSVELSFFPEQIGSETSPFEALQSMYRFEFDRVVNAVDRANSEASGAGLGVRAGEARWNFPDPSAELEF